MQLRPYQLEAVAAVELELEQHKATLLVLATGLGKTVTFAELASRLADRGGRALVVAHRGELLEQAAATLRRFGLTVAIEQGDQRVDAAALPNVVVASVQSLRGKRLARFAPDAFDLVVVDEAHHATAASYRAVLAHFAAAKVLGVTATPDRTDGVGLRNAFTSTAFRMDIAEGIAGGWLAPIELRTVVVDSLDVTGVRQVAGDLQAGQLEKELMRDATLHQVAVPLAELRAGRQTLVFTAGVKQAHSLAALLVHYGVSAAAIDGAMTLPERSTILARYRAGDLNLVCNCALWTEGFDAPETSCIALARPTRSRALLTQMIGRGTRLAEGKATCLVLDFEPARAGTIRLASPADVLAGKDLPLPVLWRVRAQSRESAGDVGALIETARQELEREALDRSSAQRSTYQEQVRLVQELGLAFAAPRVNTEVLLDAVREPEAPGWRPAWERKPANSALMTALKSAGLNPPDDITCKDARRLLDMLRERRERGLCTLKQGRKLASYGLRDDVSFTDARVAFEAIASNGWRPPRWLFNDPRFARGSAA